MSLLQELASTVTKRSKRIGRGYGSGKGDNSTRGLKGQKARTGAKIPLWFEGGQLPIGKRMPMWRGKSRFNVVDPAAEVGLSDLNKLTEETITLDTLKLHKLINPRYTKAKVINKGELTKSVKLVGIKVSKSAQKLIEKLQGSVS